MPGWDELSWGYHGDDGQKFHASGTGKAYAELYGKGDVIGCTIDQSKGTATFTKHGKDLGEIDCALRYSSIINMLFQASRSKASRAAYILWWA
jgi:hypothetical protein